MNYISLGTFNGKFLQLIGSRYVNNTISLILLNNNVQYEEITLYDRQTKLKEGYLLLNPNMSNELKNFLIKKNIFRLVKQDIDDSLEIAIINKKVYEKLLNNKIV